MDTSDPRCGGCLCGEVRYRVDIDLRPVLQCHCENCRRHTGNFMASTGSPDEHLTITDTGDNLTWYDLGYARYGFCVGCGSTMFWRAQERPGYTVIAAGTLDSGEGLALDGVWFAAEAHPYHRVPTDVPNFDRNND